MLGILARTIRIATLTETADTPRHNHRHDSGKPRERHRDLRSDAELDAHVIARRRY